MGFPTGYQVITMWAQAIWLAAHKNRFRQVNQMEFFSESDITTRH